MSVATEPQFNKAVNRDSRRPDLEFQTLDNLLRIDVSLTTATAPSYVNGAAAATGFAAKLREKAKHGKYDQASAAAKIDFAPLVVERHGTMGNECKRVCAFLAKASNQLGSHRPARFWRSVIAVATQKANHMLVRKVLADGHT